MKTIEMLVNEIKNSEALQKLLAEAFKNNALATFLKEQGCEAAVEEFIAALKAQAEQLSDDALDAVAGGANVLEGIITTSNGFQCHSNPPPVSILSFTPDQFEQCFNS